MTNYTMPKVPPATPPVIEANASAKDARDRADLEGDSDRSGANKPASEPADEKESKRAQEIIEANEAISRGNAKDGAGEQALDAMTPGTLLPPD